MLLPLRTNIQTRRTPYANYALIGLNIAFYLFEFTIDPQSGRLVPRPWMAYLVLVPHVSAWWTYITYAFLHGDLWHIFANMFFLYLFGRSVNDKLGHWAYVAFYLVGAAAAGLGQAAIHGPTATLGASGAVAAVTGAYLVLFPQSVLTVIYWFFIIGTLELPALYFILLKLIVIDNILARGKGAIAYDAHLAGYVYGIGVTLALLMSRLLDGNGIDLWTTIRHWNRRRLYRDTVANGYNPFTGEGPRKRVEAREVPRPEDAAKLTRIEEIRHEISRRIAERNIPVAADLYLELVRLDREQMLPRQHLLDVANQLASDHREAEAAQAYEQFLAQYSSYEYADQVELMLGILYARYLNRPQEAAEHLGRACEKLSDPNQLAMCRQELARLRPDRPA